MCAGAIINARIPRVVFGASDQKYGACGSVCNLFEMDFNHHPQVEKGVREEESQQLLTEFFKNLRKELKTLRDGLEKFIINNIAEYVIAPWG